MKFKIIPHQLQFKFEAGTSRGVITEKPSWFVVLYDALNPEKFGIGEVSIIPGLSIDNPIEIEKAIEKYANALVLKPDFDTINSISNEWPAVKFGLETALLDYLQKQNCQLFANDFSNGNVGIPINGLVWMGTKEQMKAQLIEKINAGYDCVKIKIGAIGFEHEFDLLKFIRTEFGNDITIRVDANGGFDESNVVSVLEQLASLQIHSIEQPVKAGQTELMASLCTQNIIPIALDEDLIPIRTLEEKQQLLQTIKPQYIILKPSLLGGLNTSKEWIQLAENQQIDWWITSALEANVGLNAIAQFTSTFDINMPQGLGTGQLYHNNIPSPLTIDKGYLWYLPNESNWNFELLDL
jgi:o-succinylbenzoate synthase